MNEEAREREYRRGYRDGWIIAIDVIDNLTGASDSTVKHLRANKLSLRDAYFKCYWFGVRQLFKWMEGDCTKVVMPPGISFSEPMP